MVVTTHPGDDTKDLAVRKRLYHVAHAATRRLSLEASRRSARADVMPESNRYVGISLT